MKIFYFVLWVNDKGMLVWGAKEKIMVNECVMLKKNNILLWKWWCNICFRWFSLNEHQCFYVLPLLSILKYELPNSSFIKYNILSDEFKQLQSNPEAF